MRSGACTVVWILGTALAGFGFIVLGPYGSLLLWSACQQAILALSYSFLGGMGGEIHLGHGAFFGLGAYASAISFQAGLPWWTGLLAAGISGALLSGALAPILVRLRGGDFAVCSLCVALLLDILARNLEEFTGGAAGLSIPTAPKAIPYACTLMLLEGTLFIHIRLINSRWGRALKAVSMDPEAARHLGIGGESLRSQAFFSGSVLASVAGGIYPLQSGYLSPESAFGMQVILAPVVAVLLGGGRSSWGPIFGATSILLVQEIVLTKFQGGTLLALGLFMVISGCHVSGNKWLSLKKFVPIKNSKADAS